MYKTDKERDRPCYYTAPELDQACADYFADCDASEPPRAPTLPGLLTYLGITEKEWKVFETGEPGYRRHPAICQKALLEMRDRLEQRKDTAAIFLLKQRAYGGYTDRPEANSAHGINIQVSFGGRPRNSTK